MQDARCQISDVKCKMSDINCFMFEVKCHICQKLDVRMFHMSDIRRQMPHVRYHQFICQMLDIR